MPKNVFGMSGSFFGSRWNELSRKTINRLAVGASVFIAAVSGLVWYVSGQAKQSAQPAGQSQSAGAPSEITAPLSAAELLDTEKPPVANNNHSQNSGEAAGGTKTQTRIQAGGETINVPSNGSVHRTIDTGDGKVKVDVENNTSSSGSSSSSTSIQSQSSSHISTHTRSQSP